MPTLYVTEFPSAAVDQGRAMPVAFAGTEVTQIVTISGASTPTIAFAETTRLVRLHTDSICSIKFGTNPTASTSTARMAANQTEYFAVQPGGGMKVAVITNT